jgi:hypothetical protein
MFSARLLIVQRVWLMRFEALVEKNTMDEQQPMYFAYLQYLMDKTDHFWLYSVQHQYTDAQWPAFKVEFIKHFGTVRRKSLTEAFTDKYEKGSLFDFVSTKLNLLRKLYPDQNDSFFIDVTIASIPADVVVEMENIKNMDVEMFLTYVQVYMEPFLRNKSSSSSSSSSSQSSAPPNPSSQSKSPPTHVTFDTAQLSQMISSQFQALVNEPDFLNQLRHHLTQPQQPPAK